MNPPPSQRRGRLLLAGIAAAVLATIGVYLYSWYAARLADQSGARPEIPVRNAPFIKSTDSVAEAMVELADLKSTDIAYDLGCGDGRIIITAALRTGCRGVGFDIDPQRVAEARENVKLHGVEHLVEIREQDVFTVNMRPANVVLLYLLPAMNKKLIPQFQQMQPGSQIISHDFGLGDITEIVPEKTVSVFSEETNDNHFVHRWTVPLKVP